MRPRSSPPLNFSFATLSTVNNFFPSGHTPIKFWKGVLFMPKTKKEEKFDPKNMKPEDKLKFEIATELGLGDKVISGGWRSLTSKESGRIGGIITKRKREMKQELLKESL